MVTNPYRKFFLLVSFLLIVNVYLVIPHPTVAPTTTAGVVQVVVVALGAIGVAPPGFQSYLLPCPSRPYLLSHEADNLGYLFVYGVCTRYRPIVTHHPTIAGYSALAA